MRRVGPALDFRRKGHGDENRAPLGIGKMLAANDRVLAVIYRDGGVVKPAIWAPRSGMLRRSRMRAQIQRVRFFLRYFDDDAPILDPFAEVVACGRGIQRTYGKPVPGNRQNRVRRITYG